MFTTKVDENVYLVDTVALGNHSTVGAYVVRGSKTAIVDCGYASSYNNVLLGLAEIGIAPSEVAYLVPTHVHLDHAGAAGHLMREMPNAELIAHERAIPHLADPSRLIESATGVFGKLIMDLYGQPIPVPERRMTAVGKEMHLDLGDGVTATLLHSPGHAPHQISVMLDRSKSLLTADAVGVVYPNMKVLIPTTPPPSLDPKMLVDTVNRLSQLDPQRLLVPHFGVREDPESVFERTKERVSAWVEEIGTMKKKGLSLDEITNHMVEEVRGELGGGDMPIYAKVLVRTSVMGITHYLDKNL